MASISDIRNGIATNLGTISGLRTSAWIPDQINPPIAIVKPDSISFDRAMQRGMDLMQFSVLAIVGRVDERSAQARLDAYCATTGASSIKAAIESDQTLGSAAFDVRVTEMRNYTSLPVGDVTYLAAEFAVEVIAQ